MMYAISSARVKRVLPGANITIFIANSQCNSIAAPVETFNMLVIDEVYCRLANDVIDEVL